MASCGILSLSVSADEFPEVLFSAAAAACILSKSSPNFAADTVTTVPPYATVAAPAVTPAMDMETPPAAKVPPEPMLIAPPAAMEPMICATPDAVVPAPTRIDIAFPIILPK